MYYKQSQSYEKPIHYNLKKSNSLQSRSSQRVEMNPLSLPQYDTHLPPIQKHRLSRGNSAYSTMTPIFEQQQQQQQRQYNNRVKIVSPPPSSHSQFQTKKVSQTRKSSSNAAEDDIPLALLAYKKGYTTIYPSSDRIGGVQQKDRINSYLSNSSSGSSSNNSLPHVTKPSRNGTPLENKYHSNSSSTKKMSDTGATTSKKKKRSESTNKRQKQRHVETLLTPPSSPPPQALVKKEKKWYTSLRTFITNNK
ncbi:unnamed protein product [Mucor hiemalis]